MLHISCDIADDVYLNSKTQTLFPNFLPQATTGYTVHQKRTDYVLAFSPSAAEPRKYYDRISFGSQCKALSAMNDTYTRMLLLFLGVEVKSDSGNEAEAKTQLALWMAANIRCRRSLAEAASGDKTSLDDVPLFGWIVIGHSWDLYAAYVGDTSSGAVVRNDVYLVIAHDTNTCAQRQSIIGPIEDLNLHTRTYHGVFALHNVISRIKDFGQDRYWEWMKSIILDPLFSSSPPPMSST